MIGHGRGYDRACRATVTVQGGVGYCLLVDGVGDCPPDMHVIERCDGRVEADPVNGGRREGGCGYPVLFVQRVPTG